MPTPFAEWILKNHEYVRIDGENNVPGFVAVILLVAMCKRPADALSLLEVLIKSVVKGSKTGELADPYHSYEEIVKDRLGLRLLDSFDETFEGSSYTLKSLILMAAYFECKEVIETNWRDITYIQQRSFIPKEKWHWFLMYNSDGLLTTEFPKATQSWAELRAKSREISENLPILLTENPHLVLLMWQIYPYRFNVESLTFFLNKTVP